MPAALIAGAFFAEGSFAFAATAFAIRVAMTFAIASLVSKNQQPNVAAGTAGGEIMLQPYTDNKLPVVYGDSFVEPIIVDAILSEDNQTMWYVLAFSELTSGTTHFEEVYFNSKLLMFNTAAEGSMNEISGWWTVPKKHSKIGGTITTNVSGKIGMYFYASDANGNISPIPHRCFSMPDPTTGTVYDELRTTDVSALSVLTDGAIDPSLQWTSADKMTNSVFAIVRLNYDSKSGVTGLPTIRAKLSNTLKAPGDVMLDYMTNSSYGCAITLDHINTASTALINSLSTAPLNITDTFGNLVNSPFTYEINGILDTTKDCLSNLNDLSNACDSWIQWDERKGKWSIIPNISIAQAGLTTATMTVVTSDQIIGGINLVPTDLKSSANKITISFPNSDIINQTDYRYYWLDPQFLSPNEPENNIDINFPFVTDSIQGTYLGYRKLWMSREDMVINFTMDYSGIKINAGDVIAIRHEWYGWPGIKPDGTLADVGTYNGLVVPGKPFRVTQVKETKDPSGFLSVQISAVSYNNAIYTTMNPHYYTPDEFGLLNDANYIGPPGQPTAVGDTLTNAIVVTSAVPTSGLVAGMEFWYGNTSTILINNFALYEVQNYVTTSTTGVVTPLYPHSGSESIHAFNLPAGTYYWATRAVGPNSVSDFSPVSSPVTWAPNINGTLSGSQILDNSISGSKVVTGNPATTGQPGSKGFFDTLGPIALGGLGLAGAYYAYTNGLFDADKVPAVIHDYSDYAYSTDNLSGGGQGGGTQDNTVTQDVIYTDNQGNPVDTPQVGDTQVINVAVNENYGPPTDYVSDTDVV